VLLVEPVRDGARMRMRAVDIHAGGLAIVGCRIRAAAAHDGLGEVDLGDMLRVKHTCCG